MNYKIIISIEAQNDLEDIYRYISEVLYLPENAWIIIQSFYNSINSLCTMPNRHKKVDIKLLADRNIRCYQIRNYKIYYHVNDIEKEVIILRITYYKMDLSNIFSSLDKGDIRNEQ